MSANALPDHDVLLDLLAERSTSGIDATSEDALQALLADHSGIDADELDAAAATFAVAFANRDGVESLPSGLRRSLNAAAAAFTAEFDDGAAAPLPFRGSTDADVAFHAIRQEGRVPVLAWGGWLAAAASLLIAVLVTAPNRAMTPRQQLVALLDSASDAVSAEWASLTGLELAAEDHRYDAGVAGRVVWAEDRDEGYMEISGLHVNDPEVEQYQLWIFDATRPQGEFPGVDGVLSQRPIDGGVFDFKPGPDGTAVIPIDAKLLVGDAVIFAVTLEPPGGVVVSDRDIVFGAAL